MNAKQEILDALKKAHRMTTGATCAIFHERIRSILETHTLEPIDERPFDPTLCGFEAEARDGGGWSNGDCRLFYLRGRGLIEEEKANHLPARARFPWPATQSDGERLLKLLGVLE